MCSDGLLGEIVITLKNKRLILHVRAQTVKEDGKFNRSYAVY